MRIAQLHRVFYPPEPTLGNWRCETTPSPTWEQIEAAVRAMHPWERPLVTLQRHENVSDREIMTVCGGDERFHLQIADDSGWWLEACRTDAPGEAAGEEVCVWRSDQGFVTTADRVWPGEEAVCIARHYCEADSLPPGAAWQWV
ncbi:hypothetical protein [Alienimonas sp. DA493]|uniref:hypothetical protein n=1 Tax=Alienimonas sp. DA493 TaxID=3373605 RepID=UPI0037542F2F